MCLSVIMAVVEIRRKTIHSIILRPPLPHGRWGWYSGKKVRSWSKYYRFYGTYKLGIQREVEGNFLEK